MNLKPIITEADHLEAIERIEQLMDGHFQAGSVEAEELSALTLLVSNYESRNYPIPPPDPVDALLFRMEQQNLTPRDLLPFLGSRSKVSEVLSRKRPLTLSMIRALHFGLGIPASTLLAEKSAPQKSLFSDYGQFPLALMAKRGWLTATEWEIKNRPREVLEGFFSKIGTLSDLAAAFRTGEHIRSGRSMDEHALLVWTIRIATKALEVSAPPYRPGLVTLEFMRSVARLSTAEDAPLVAQKFLAENGIVLCVEPHLPQTYLDGAAVFYSAQRPVIGMTIRYDRVDNFWFTLMHELAHICCHLDAGVKVFFDDLDVDSQSNSREREADAIAREALVPNEVWQKSPASKLPSPEAAIHLARTLQIHPAIAAGRIRYERKKYRLLPNLVGSGDIRRAFPNLNWSP